jgi:DNA polymerase-3 subunit gamma/tau
MSYQVLARKWRPKSFSELVGQEAVVQALVNGLDHDRVHHAFLFTGTRGVGKTTIARILAKCLNCETNGVSSKPCGECASCDEVDSGRFLDMLEIDAASRTKVEDTRELLESVQFAPTRGRFKVYIIDEVHMLSTSSFNALLKTLEEPPSHVKFVLATTDPQKIPVTILSRCLRFNLRRLLPEEISSYLESILTDEQVESEARAVERIARAADGSMRDALSLLDQAIAFGGGALRDDEVAQMMGSVDHAHIVNMIESLGQGDATRLMEIIRELSSQARDLESVLAELAEVFHRMGLVQCVPDYRDPERSDWESIKTLASTMSPEDVQLYYQIAIQGKRDLGLAPDPRTGLEMSLLRMLAFRPGEAGDLPAATPGPGQAAKPDPAKTEAKPAGSTAKAPAEKVAVPKAPAEKVAAPKAPEEPVASPPPLVLEPDQEVDWHQLLARLDLTGPVKELARNIQLESAGRDKWDFLIPDAVKDLGTSSIVQKLQSALSTQLGQQVNLNIHTATESVHTPAVVSEQAALKQMSEAERAITDDSTVKSLKERFDAVIIEDSVQPLQ